MKVRYKSGKTLNKFQISLGNLLEAESISDSALNSYEVSNLLEQVNSEWTVSPNEESEPILQRQFKLDNYQEAVRIALLASKVAERYNHHPEITFSWNHCTIRYFTHSSQSLSLKDFVCALATDIATDNKATNTSQPR